MKGTKDSYKPSKMVEIVTQNKLCITIIVLIVYLATMLGVCLGCAWDWEKIYYISQIIGGLFVVGGLVVSILQYTASNIANTLLRNQERKIRAAEMANNFQKDLIPLMNIISAAYNDSKLSSTVLEKVNNAKLEMFNKEEILNIISEEERNAMLPKLHSAYLVKNYVPVKIDKDSETSKTLSIDYNNKDKEEALHIIKSTLTKLANSLEYFSMYFNSGIADENTVYQSLHGVFFRCVNLIYPFAFYKNEKESDRLFSNISSLYLKWRRKHDELAEEEKKEINQLKNRVKDKIVVKNRD